MYLRGATYGTFRRDASDGTAYPDPGSVARDFGQMAANGLNAVRTYTVPPRRVLDLAAEHGLLVMVGIPWEQHVPFLDERARARSIEERVRAGVAACAGHPALLCYAVGNEIRSQIVRWHGARAVERFLERLYAAAKSEDPEGLVTYVNYPSTEYLELPFLDVACFNVYLEAQHSLEAYVARLHNVSGERPLILAELGLDSRRHGEDTQARTLEWQIRSTFESGCAGAFVFAWTDEWHMNQGEPELDFEVNEWDFGLTDRERRPKPALAAVAGAYSEVPFSTDSSWPRVSVMVCTHNGARTLSECLDGLRTIAYPDFEVIVVSDGSTDATAEIVHRHGFRLIRRERMGLAAARNAGMQAAGGEIVAYIDDDARPDPHWLTYIADSFRQGSWVAVGGPNLAPDDDGWMAEAVANSPGGPTHVLLRTKTPSTYLAATWPYAGTPCKRSAGSTRCFVSQAMTSTCAGGCETAAGSSASTRGRRMAPASRLAARLLAPAARLRRGRSAGRAQVAGEIQRRRASGLERADIRGGGQMAGDPCPAAHPLWEMGERAVPIPVRARSPAAGRDAVDAGVVPRDRRARAPRRARGVLAATAPRVNRAGARRRGHRGPGLPRRGTRCCSGWARLVDHARLRYRAMIAVLHLVQPAARLSGRIRGGLTPWRARGRWILAVPRPRRVAIWSESWRGPEERIRDLEEALKESDRPVRHGGSFDRWDLEVGSGRFGSARLLMAIEDYPQGKQLVHWRCWPRFSSIGVAAAIACGALAAGAASGEGATAALILAVLGIGLVVRTVIDAAAATGAVVEALHAARIPARHASSMVTEDGRADGAEPALR